MPGDSPTAYSRWKIGRSLTSSRIVIAVPIRRRGHDQDGQPLHGSPSGRTARCRCGWRRARPAASPGTTRLSAPSTIGISTSIASSSRSANTIARLRRTSVDQLAAHRLQRRRTHGRVARQAADRCPSRPCGAGIRCHRSGSSSRSKTCGIVLAAEVLEHPGRRAEVRQPAAGREHEDVVAHVEREHRVRHDHDDPAVVGEGAQLVHDVAVEARVEARGRLVEEQQRRRGQQLGRDRDPLALAAGELGADPVVDLRGPAASGRRRGRPVRPLLLGGVGRQPQHRGERAGPAGR